MAGSIPIPRTVPLIVTEGNYLLLDTHPWTAIRELLDEAWYVEQDDGVRVERLIARHIATARSRTSPGLGFWAATSATPN